MWGLPQKQNARRADKIRLCGHLRRYKKIVKKIYIIYYELNYQFLRRLQKEGLITLKSLFIDGTKIEANANRYTFV